MKQVPNDEQIQARAYEIFIKRGGEHGHDVEDWFAAERELIEEPEQATYASRSHAPNERILSREITESPLQADRAAAGRSK